MEEFSRRWKKALVHSQKAAELDLLEGLLKDSSSGTSIRHDIVKVLSERQSQQKRFRLITSGAHGDCRVRPAYSKEGDKQLSEQEGATTNVDKSNSVYSCTVVSKEK